MLDWPGGNPPLKEEKGWWRRTYAMQRRRVIPDTSLPRKFTNS